MGKMLLEASLRLDCGNCEQKLGLGVKGECNVETQSCDCPLGYSGNDEFALFTSCHVNDTLFKGLHWVRQLGDSSLAGQLSQFIVM